jgi:CDK-activating kinase assembly factor MAT1
MNVNLKLLINPTCYHKMCQSCVDRVFLHGKANCPIPGCKHTLKKSGFRTQTFEDLKVEREVDIRKEVAAVFNRREDDFESLRDYNDYLNTVEDIIFNLVNLVDVEATKRKFEQYKVQHEKEIKENASLAEQEALQSHAQHKAEREQARQRREAARREEAEERREVEENRRDVLRRLERGQDPAKVAKEGQQIALRRRQDRQIGAEPKPQPHGDPSSHASEDAGGLAFRGLRTRQKAEPEGPVDPFGGITFHKRKYFTPQDDYVWDALQVSKKDPLIGAGGYSIQSYTNRALCEAFLGLGVFVADEAAERQTAKIDGGAVGTARAQIGVRTMHVEDPF